MNEPSEEKVLELLAQARSLSDALERLRADAPDEALSVRLACAHSLGVIDQLEDALRYRARSRSGAASSSRTAG